MEYHILASGSKGNAAFIFHEGEGILIDCGITRKQLIYKLEQLGFKESDIHYVLLTHDHYDHNKNIHIFDKDMIYTAKKNMESIDDEHTLEPYTYKRLGVFNLFTLRTSHDASDPIGFIIETDEKMLFMTDTGYISRKNMGYMNNLDYYIIESNHDIEMLMQTRRPKFLKDRILNDVGHLNNEYCTTVMKDVIGESTKEVVLAHLSGEANTHELAYNTFYKMLDETNRTNIILKTASQVDVVSGGKFRD